MTLLTVQEIVRGGTAPTYAAAAAAGNQFINTGRAFVHIRNGGTAAITTTVNSIRPCDQGFNHNEVVNIPAGADRMIGPFAPVRFNNAEQRVSITYSGVTTVTIAVLGFA